MSSPFRSSLARFLAIITVTLGCPHLSHLVFESVAQASSGSSPQETRAQRRGRVAGASAPGLQPGLPFVLGDWFSHRPSVLNLKVPGRTAESVITVHAFLAVAPVEAFLIDVDLNRDGHFHGVGELAYASGSFHQDGVGEGRLSGLVP